MLNILKVIQLHALLWESETIKKTNYKNIVKTQN